MRARASPSRPSGRADFFFACAAAHRAAAASLSTSSRARGSALSTRSSSVRTRVFTNAFRGTQGPRPAAALENPARFLPRDLGCSRAVLSRTARVTMSWCEHPEAVVLRGADPAQLRAVPVLSGRARSSAVAAWDGLHWCSRLRVVRHCWLRRSGREHRPVLHASAPGPGLEAEGCHVTPHHMRPAVMLRAVTL